jgi:hypothetical protein
MLQPLLRIFEPILKNASRELLHGSHTRSISISTPSNSGIMKFAKKQLSCIGCKALIRYNSIPSLFSFNFIFLNLKLLFVSSIYWLCADFDVDLLLLIVVPKIFLEVLFPVVHMLIANWPSRLVMMIFLFAFLFLVRCFLLYTLGVLRGTLRF